MNKKNGFFSKIMIGLLGAAILAVTGLGVYSFLNLPKENPAAAPVTMAQSSLEERGKKEEARQETQAPLSVSLELGSVEGPIIEKDGEEQKAEVQKPENTLGPETEAEAGTETDTGDYILPDSNQRYLTNKDLKALTKEKTALARNEIYARHGRSFQNKSIQAYFESKDWYEKIYEPEEFDAMGSLLLNEYEMENIKRIIKYEKEKGYQ